MKGIPLEKATLCMASSANAIRQELLCRSVGKPKSHGLYHFGNINFFVMDIMKMNLQTQARTSSKKQSSKMRFENFEFCCLCMYGRRVMMNRTCTSTLL